MGHRVNRWVRALAIALVIAAAVVFVYRLDPARAAAVLAGASAPWVVLAIALNGVVRLGTRVLRSRALLVVLPGQVALYELARVIYGSVALGYLTSPIAGSAARVIALQRRGVPSESVVAAQLWEKVLTGCALAGFAAPLLLRDTPAAVHYALLVAALLGSAGAVAAVLVVAGFRRFERRGGAAPRAGVRRWLFELGRSLSRLHDLRVLLRALAWSVISELSDVIMLGLALRALGAPIDPAACVLGYIAVNAGSAVPTTPGQLGVFEAATAWALIATGVPASTALAAGLLYHVSHVVPALALGLPSLSSVRRAPG
jgi:uncharacterized membrane protein YbhN (UPF0104 family)